MNPNQLLLMLSNCLSYLIFVYRNSHLYFKTNIALCNKVRVIFLIYCNIVSVILIKYCFKVRGFLCLKESQCLTV